LFGSKVVFFLAVGNRGYGLTVGMYVGLLLASPGITSVAGAHNGGVNY